MHLGGLDPWNAKTFRRLFLMAYLQEIWRLQFHVRFRCYVLGANFWSFQLHYVHLLGSALHYGDYCDGRKRQCSHSHTKVAQATFCQGRFYGTPCRTSR